MEYTGARPPALPMVAQQARGVDDEVETSLVALPLIQRAQRVCRTAAAAAVPTVAVLHAHCQGASALLQGLTLVHISAQLERFVSDRGCT
jgi:hypothetical protein